MLTDVKLEGLQAAIAQCNERRLLTATTWLTELYASANPSLKAQSSANCNNSPDAVDGPREVSFIRLAQNQYDNRKLHGVSRLLQDCKSPIARFLSYYAQYLIGERKAQEVWISQDSNRDRRPAPENTSLNDIHESIGDTDDSFLIFLRAILLVGSGKRALARENLIRSLNLQPWNWSAWMQLGCCFEKSNELKDCLEKLPNHVMTDVFKLRMGIEMNLATEADSIKLDSLLQAFPESFYLLSLKAQVCFQQKDWITAEQIWEHILATDPFRIDDIDQYSNMLFIMKKKDKLFKLAHAYMEIDEVRPEVQTLIGNYFSIMDDHDKAIKCFTRGVLLDKSYKTAWTLIGHEYTYLKNFHAAIEAYRRAIDISRLDFRAWYGLGRAYDGLSMPTYSINYYTRALSLFPYDATIWEATGLAYAALNKPQQAIPCLRKSLAGSDTKNPTDSDKTLYLKMAALFESLEASSDAAECHRQVITVCRKLGRPISEYARSCTSLARFHLSEAMEVLKNPSPVPGSQGAAPSIFNCRHYLELLIADSNARGGSATNDEVNIAKEMLKRLEEVRLPR